VCPIIWVFDHSGSDRQDPNWLSQKQDLIAGVLNIDPQRAGIDNQQLGLSDKNPQPGQPLSRRPLRDYSQQLKLCGQLFTWPTDQPRHATLTSNYPVESSSPPFKMLASLFIKRNTVARTSKNMAPTAYDLN